MQRPVVVTWRLEYFSFLVTDLVSVSFTELLICVQTKPASAEVNRELYFLVLMFVSHFFPNDDCRKFSK